MGVTLFCNKGKSFDFTFSGFARFRNLIAKKHNAEWGREYENLPAIADDSVYKNFDALTFRMLNDGELSVEIVDFCLQPDVEGSVSSKTCKILTELLKGEKESRKIFTYTAHTDGRDMEHILGIIQDCVKHHKKLRWN